METTEDSLHNATNQREKYEELYKEAKQEEQRQKEKERELKDQLELTQIELIDVKRELQELLASKAYPLTEATGIQLVSLLDGKNIASTSKTLF